MLLVIVKMYLYFHFRISVQKLQPTCTNMECNPASIFVSMLKSFVEFMAGGDDDDNACEPNCSRASGSSMYH